MAKSSPLFRQPFDMLAETATTVARVEAGECAKSAKSEIWLTTQVRENRSGIKIPCFQRNLQGKRENLRSAPAFGITNWPKNQ